MADRTVKVTLIAQATGYIAGMDAAARKTRELGSEADKLAQKRQSFEVLGRAAIGIGLAVGTAVGISIKKFAEFDRAMSQVKAVTQETASNMTLLRDAALEAGGRTIYTATEAANAIEELGKNGLTTAQILGGGLDAALDIAASGNLEVARAAEIAAITMKQFQLTGEQLPHLADLLAAGAGKAAGDVEDLAQALNQSALVAKQTGFTVEETTGVLAAFADAGLIGSDAGTSFKTMLQRLTPVSAESKQVMEELGISAYDAQGNFIGAAKFADNLHNSLKGLTVEQRNAALAQIFGTDAVRAATVFYNLGADGIQEYIDKTNDSGYAAKVAADRLNNLSGDVEKLGGSLDTVFIKSGSGANDVLRGLVQSATALTDFVGDMPEPVLAVGLAFGVTTAAMALTGGTALRLVPGIAAVKTGMATMGISARTAAVGIGVAGLAMTGVTLIIAGVVSHFAEASARTVEFKDSLNQATGELTAYSRELVKKKLAESGAFTAAKEAGISQRELTDRVIEGGAALDEVYEKLTRNNTAVTFFQGIGEGKEWSLGIRAGNASQAIRDLSGSLDQAQEDWRDEAAAQSAAAAATAENEQALAELGGQAYATGDAVDELSQQILNFGKSQLDLNDANRAVQAALDDFDAKLAENGATLDINTAAGRENSDALDNIADSYLRAAAAAVKQSGDINDAIPYIEAAREAYIRAAMGAGDTADEAARAADSVGLIPENVGVLIQALGVDVFRAKIDRLIADYQNRVIPISAVVRQSDRPNARGGFYDYVTSARGNLIEHQAFAAGGFASGIYAGRPGGIHKFAEPETRWEAYISGKPGDRARNVGIWEEAGTRLGAWDYGGRGGTSSAINGPVQVSLAGATLRASIDGVPFDMRIEDHIQAYDRGNQLTMRMGRQNR